MTIQLAIHTLLSRLSLKLKWQKRPSINKFYFLLFFLLDAASAIMKLVDPMRSTLCDVATVTGLKKGDRLGIKEWFVETRDMVRLLPGFICLRTHVDKYLTSRATQDLSYLYATRLME